MADEQAALWRVAQLAARGTPELEVCRAVTREVSALLGTVSALVRFDGPGTDVVVSRDDVLGPAAEADLLPGGRAVVSQVQRTSRPARLRADPEPSELSELSEQSPRRSDQDAGVAVAVAVPVLVGEQLWGALSTSVRDGDVDLAEQWLLQFGELVGTAVANAAARGRLEELAAEKAALLRVAELVAAAAAPQEVFDAVTAEASALLGGRPVTLVRFASDHEIVVIAERDGPVPLGTIIEFEPGTQPYRLRQGGGIDRVDDWTHEPNVLLASRYGLVAAVSAPIAVGGRVWGTLTATSGVEPLPAVTEDRLDKFARLVSAMLTNGESEERLRALVEEQIALRRVAELVARGATLDEVFHSAATEASRLLDGNPAALVRYEEEGPRAIAVAVAGSRVPVAAWLPVDARGAAPRAAQPVRVDGRGQVLPGPSDQVDAAGEIAAPVMVEGRLWGALTTSTSSQPFLAETGAWLTPFAELVAAAIANAGNRAALSASRARVVATADETRRQLQRDVHDGAQQRLVHTIIALKLALRAVRAGEAPGDLLEEALLNAERANMGLRDIVHGILPATLTRGGLGAALQEMVADVSIPVDLSARVSRLPAAVETTAYFVVAEAMTNILKHSGATRASVDVRLEGGALVLEIHDDGVGGADRRGGSGLTGLSDRVEANAGTLSVTSEPEVGTTVRATIPLSPPAASEGFVL